MNLSKEQFIEKTDVTPAAASPIALDAKTLKGVRTNIIMGFVLTIAGTLLNVITIPGYPLQNLLLSCAGPVLMLLTFLMYIRENKSVCLGCSAGYLALRLWSASGVLRSASVTMMTLLGVVAGLVISVMLLMMALGKLRQKGLLYTLVAICAIITLCMSLSPLFNGYQLSIMNMVTVLCSAIGVMLITIYGFALNLTEKQFKRFTTVLGVILAVLVILSIGAFIALGGMDTNAPKTNLEEAQEWVWNNFRVDSNGNLFWN